MRTTTRKGEPRGRRLYYDDEGKVRCWSACSRAEQQLGANRRSSRNYLPIDGLPAYDVAVQELAFGAGSPAITRQRMVTVQAISGTAA